MMERVWRSAFDRVVVIKNTALRGRLPSLERELARVSLGSFAASRWTFPTPFVARFSTVVRGPGMMMGNFDEAVFGMYAELKESYELGRERILVLEDDVRFLRDLDLLRAVVTSIPDDFQVAKLSWIRRGGVSRERIHGAPRVRGFWVPVTGVMTRDTGALAFSRRGMEWMIECYESAVRPGGELRCCDMYDRPPWYTDDGRFVYLALPLAARQAVVGRRMSRVDFESYYGDFQAPCGYGGAA